MSVRTCFLYGSLLDPDVLGKVAPSSSFERVAHLPEHRLTFTVSGHAAVVPDEGHTVWGCVFEMPEDEYEAIVASRGEPDTTIASSWAVTRDGERVWVEVVSGPEGGGADADRISEMVRGARHWELPAGWIVGLEDLIDPFDF